MALIAVFLVPAFLLCYIISCVTSVGDQCQISLNATSLNRFSGSCPAYPEITSHDLLPSHVAFHPVRRGSDVRLACASCEQPLHNVLWRRILTKGSTFSKSGVRCDGNYLIIPNFQCSDQGNYVCTAACGDRPVSERWKSVWIRDQSCQPTISDPIQIENNVTGRIGELLTLPCTVTYGNTLYGGLSWQTGFHSNWFRGRVSGPVYSGFHLCNNNYCGKYFQCQFWENVGVTIQQVNLTINSLKKDDGGWYTCMALTFTDVEANIYYYLTVSDTSKPGQNGSGSLGQQLQTGNRTPLIAGLIVMVITLISIFLVIVIVWWRRRSSDKKRLSGDTSRHLGLSKFVYVSYAEDTPTHVSNVKSMASQLSESFDCHLYDEHRNEAAHMFVHNWLSQQITEASYVIIVASPRYRRLAEQMQQNSSDIRVESEKEFVDWEQRVRYEWNLIQSRGFLHQPNLSFCISVLWDGSDESDILFPLSTSKRFRWPGEMSKLRDYLETEGLRCNVSETNKGGGDGGNKQEIEDEKVDVTECDSVSFNGARLVFDAGEEVQV